MKMKLWLREQNFLTNIFKSKPHTPVTSSHGQITHFKTLQTFAMLFQHFKTIVTFSDLRLKILKTFESIFPWQKKLINVTIFNFKNCFKLYTSSVTHSTTSPVIISQGVSLVQVYAISRNWDTRGKVYTPQLPCTLTIEEKRCAFSVFSILFCNSVFYHIWISFCHYKWFL